MVSMSPRSREDLLRVLLDTAADLTGLRDVEAVLQAIVRRTRTIVGSDMAYVSLNDADRGETYIRQADGVATAAYRTIRMPLGTGVLGQVATGLAPYQTSDYLTDKTFTHLPQVDAIVRAEGVRAIMGVPLTVVGRVIGALVVAERRPRRFSAEEVDIVDSISTHAAVALDNSMRFQAAERLAEDMVRQQRRSAEELSLITGVLELDRRLMEAVMVAPDVRRILQVGRSVLGCELQLVDPDDAVIATTSEAPSPTGRDTTPLPAVTTVAVTAASEQLGSRVAPVALSDHDVALLERVAVHVTLAMLFARTQEDTDRRLQSEMLDDLLEGRNAPRERLERRMQHWGLRPADGLYTVVIDTPAPESRRRLQAIRTAGMRGTAIVHSDHVCLLTSDPSWRVTLRRIHESHNWPLRAGFGGPYTDVREVADAHRCAELALGSLIAQERQGIVDGSELGMLGALLDLDRRGHLPRGLTAVISPLVEYDVQRGTCLALTAFHYLETDGNVTSTSQLLHVHRNTVRQRLERITALLGEGWDSSPRRLEIHLALRVLHSRGDLG
jgi:hypothetical protein